MNIEDGDEDNERDGEVDVVVVEEDDGNSGLFLEEPCENWGSVAVKKYTRHIFPGHGAVAKKL